jgi:hemerythrin
MPVQWSSHYELGHERIDAEHRIFLRLIDEFARRVEEGLPLEALQRTAHEIRQYAEFHFVCEENTMEEMGYPGLTEHRQCHADLLGALDEKRREMAERRLDPRALQDFLVDWFLQHTAEEDQKLVAHIRSLGGSRLNIINPFF